MGADGYPSSWDPTAGASEFNMIDFLIVSRLARMSTMTLAKVVAVNEPSQPGLGGTVDVQPLVNLIDGADQPSPHGTLHGLPYARLQGGTNAIIADPQVGDVGLAAFADRDISAVVANAGAQSNPGSRRRFDMADGVFVGGLLNVVPTQYLQFLVGGGLNLVDSLGNSLGFSGTGTLITPKSGQNHTVQGNEVVNGTETINGNETVNGNEIITGTLGVTGVSAFTGLIGANGGIQIASGGTIAAMFKASVNITATPIPANTSAHVADISMPGVVTTDVVMLSQWETGSACVAQPVVTTDTVQIWAMNPSASVQNFSVHGSVVVMRIS